MNTDEMIQMNNRLREKLAPENREYYEKMLLYLRSSPVPQHQTEELLLEWLEHVLEAEKQGKTAREVFGPDPEGYCEEVVAAMPRRGWGSLGKEILFITWLGLTWTLFVHGALGIILMLVGEWWEIPFREGYQPDQLSLLFVIQILGLFFLVHWVFHHFRKTVFSEEEHGVRENLKFGLTFAAGFGLIWLLEFWLDRWLSLPTLPLSPVMSLILGAVFYAVYRVWIRKLDF
ncbi:DUF1129 family protein [Kroppenstedtia eburnea]|uniref:DUF1129 domain-containing protein n=1 Tax=Kroppenstedtia eburnea TaxID=714067 RepID=A0A1N7NRN2_9BACL|nr:DUF1129 family protein [Kroppenstedtia eburnea]QKI81129.1 DUF1129 family protein [Kroppenstedtia eburnea]SIT00984.1 Protein of unknown function [Kroppenstedtia eburnea]